MLRIRFIHWKPTEAAKSIEMLKIPGFEIDFEPFSNQIMAADRKDPPDIIVIDLSRIPSQGRDLGIAYRTYKDTRRCPIVFVGGEPGKVAGIRSILPDALFSSWSEIVETIDQAVSEPLTDPVVPESRMQGYAGTALPKKLGIKEGTVIALINAPDDFEDSLGELPRGVRLKRNARGNSDLTLWFVTKQNQITKRIEKMVRRANQGGLWIIWPKKSSGFTSDLTQNVVRKMGLDAGMVDFKVASIDEIWSGLRFSVRKQARADGD